MEIIISHYLLPFLLFSIMKITTGAPKIDVTVLMFNSIGANAILAIRSQIIQNTAPPRKVAGITTSGLEVFSAPLIRKGTAIPTNEIGPANAVTQAENTLDIRIRNILKVLMLTPILCA